MTNKLQLTEFKVTSFTTSKLMGGCETLNPTACCTIGGGCTNPEICTEQTPLYTVACSPQCCPMNE